VWIDNFKDKRKCCSHLSCALQHTFSVIDLNCKIFIWKIQLTCWKHKTTTISINLYLPVKKWEYWTTPKRAKSLEMSKNDATFFVQFFTISKLSCPTDPDPSRTNIRSRILLHSTHKNPISRRTLNLLFLSLWNITERLNSKRASWMHTFNTHFRSFLKLRPSIVCFQWLAQRCPYIALYFFQSEC